MTWNFSMAWTRDITSSKGGSEEEEGPERAETELYHEPGDDVELLHGVDEVHHQQHRAHPEPGHRHENEPLAHRLLLVVGRGDHHTHKPQQVRQDHNRLDCTGQSLDVTWVPSEVDLDMRLRDGRVGLELHAGICLNIFSIIDSGHCFL